jgi:hypothetical protein
MLSQNGLFPETERWWWTARREVIENLCWVQLLTEDELTMCEKSAVDKYKEVGTNNREQGYGPGNNTDGPDWHIKGRIRELVVANKTGLPWDPEIRYRRGEKDVGKLLEVRGTDKVEGSMFLKYTDPSKPHRQGDEGKGPVVLVEKLARNAYFLAGWIDADYALTRGGYKKVGGKGTKTDLGIWVPQNDLWPMEYIEIIVREHKRKTCGQRGSPARNDLTGVC